MSYKDEERAKEANRERQRRYREKALLKGVTSEGVTGGALPESVTPNLELCRTCGELLPPLERPRKYPGMCLPCVTKKYHKGVPFGLKVG